jgi:hypothetical protein
VLKTLKNLMIPRGRPKSYGGFGTFVAMDPLIAVSNANLAKDSLQQL